MLLGFTVSKFQEEIFWARQDRSIHEKICMWEKSGVFQEGVVGEFFQLQPKKESNEIINFTAKEQLWI